MWYFVISVTLFLSSAFSFEDSWIEEESAIKIADCSETISNSSSGNFSLPTEQNCDAYDIILKSTEETSIFHLKAFLQHIGKGTDSRQNESASYAEESVKILIYERTVHQDGEGEDILLAQWELQNGDEQSSWTHQSYLSRTSKVKIHVEAPGIDYKLTLGYEEIKYETNEISPGETEPQKTFEGTYRPNTVHIYRLKAVSSTNWSSTLVMLEAHIDTAMGEYLLIGAGKEPFEGPRPLLISQPMSTSTYYVGDPNVYIMFISNSMQKNRTVKIDWEHVGIRTSREDPKDPLDALRLRQICFYNDSWALDGTKELQEEEVFNKFRERFAEESRSNAVRHKLADKESLQSLSASSVRLYLMKNSSSLLNVTVQVKYQEKALLNWRQLGEIIDIIKVNSSSMFGFTIDHCSTTDAGDRKTWNFVMYLIVPVFAVFFLMIWAWKQKVLPQNCPRQKEDKFSSQQSSIIHVEPNFYEPTQTIPKLVETSDQGRRRTLVAGNSIQENVEDGNANETDMIDMTAIPSTSEEPVSTRQLLSISRNKRRHSILPQKQKEGDSSQILKIEKNESDHLCDTVSSENSTTETKL